VFSHDGVEQQSIDLGDGNSVVVGGESAPGHVIADVSVGVHNYERKGRIYVVDLASGVATQKADGLCPTSGSFGYYFSCGGKFPTPGSEATKLYYTGNHSFIHYDVETGERQPIASLKQLK